MSHARIASRNETLHASGRRAARTSLIINTGDGKGKTTAALGLAARAHNAVSNIDDVPWTGDLRRSQ